MEFTVNHRTTYRYPARVHDSYTVMTLQPRSDTEQYCTRFRLLITPFSRVFSYGDRYANDVHYFAVLPEHDTLSVVSSSHVVTVRQPVPAPPQPAALPALTDSVGRGEFYDFTHESAYVRFGREIAELVEAVGDPADAAAWFVRAGHLMHERFVYDTEATTVHTAVAETVRRQRGVCQDFAHVLVTACRWAGVPARYVSGYVFSGQAGSVLGAEASHAWCEAYLGPQNGWVGFDPTNDTLITDRFVKIAVGRDYADVTPVRGVYKGSSHSVMSVDVSVEALSPAQQQQ